MSTDKIVVFVVLMLISVGAFILSWLQFKERGFLFNNAYLYASKEEREMMNKKPYYRQSAIISLLLGLIFLLNAIGLFVTWFSYISIIAAIASVIFAVVSSKKIKWDAYLLTIVLLNRLPEENLVFGIFIWEWRNVTKWLRRCNYI